MVDFITFEDLRRFNDALTMERRVALKSHSASKNNKDTFLSHSSKDEEYLPSVIHLLESHGASVYCDLGDDRLPVNPNPETALILKKQIKVSRKQVVFITKNSQNSKWVPWELGIGDIYLSSRNVALLPVTTNKIDQSWAQQEYLGLYRHIVWGQLDGFSSNLWLVYDYRTNTAERLNDWLAS